MDGLGLGLGFVFEKWLDTQMFTDHSAAVFRYNSASVELVLDQGRFEHTNKVDHTGTVVWDDAVLLARFLERKAARKPGCFEKKSVLELGAGVGLPGLLLAKLGADVVVSDRDEHAKELLERNIRQNGLRDKCRGVVYEWGKEMDLGVGIGQRFDVILASGCVYHEESVPPLVSTLKKVSHASSVIYIAVDFRFDVRERQSEYVSPVLESFLQHEGVRLEPVPDEDLDPDYIKNSIRLYTCQLT